MKIDKCSNCGKYSHKSNKYIFDDRELKLKIKNYKGIKYNLRLDFWAIPEYDDNLLQEFSKTIFENDEELQKHGKILDRKLLDNYPILCNKCRMALINFTMKYGRQDKFVNF